MGTKESPGEFDCYANAEPKEPYFVLLGRDPMAGFLVRVWAYWRRMNGEDPRKVQEALLTAAHLDEWARGKGKTLHAIGLYHLSRIWETIMDIRKYKVD